MNKSFIERIFPHNPNSPLPQYEYDSSTPRTSTSSATNRISLRDRSYSLESATKLAQSIVKSAPMSASVVHHDDPFLPIERAAKGLERTLQDLIDVQSDKLESILPQDQQDDLSSVDSSTPTPSLSVVSRNADGSKAVPIRQPKPKRVTIRSVRKSLARTMDEFATLKKEELRIIQAETRSRDAALRKTDQYKSRRQSLRAELEAAQNDGSASSPAALRSEAEEVAGEIQELEHRLFELRTRHRHLLDRAGELENTIESKLSSFKHSMAAAERELRDFLRHPPVSCSLSNYDDGNSTGGGMYALHADRRTLEMAEEQWSTEQKLLEDRKSNALMEQQALRDGADLWRKASVSIDTFEKALRQKLAPGEVPPSTSDDIARELDDLINSLKNDYAVSEAKNWKLLMVATGAELAALNRARELLVGPSPVGQSGLLADDSARSGSTTKAQIHQGDINDDPPADLLNGSVMAQSRRRDSESSNESLKATQEQFSDQAQPMAKGKLPVRTQNHMADGNDSEDDGPSADFLLSHT